MKKLSVLTLIDMDPKKMGAVEEYALHLSRELIRRGHFAAVGFSKSPPDWLMEKFNLEGVRVFQFNPSNGSITFMMDLRKKVNEFGFNIIHSTFYDYYSIWPIIATFGKGVKLIYSDQISRTFHPSQGIKSLFRFIKNRLLQKFIYAIIADAQFIKNCQIRDLFTQPEKVPIIYNGVNLERFKKADSDQRSQILSKFNIPSDSSIIVTVAKCIPEKGLRYYIDTAKIVIESQPKTIFFVIGDGPEQSSLEKQAKELGLKEHVIFTGLRVDTEAFLSIADVFVLLSVWEEAFAFSLLEAAASGCPIIATRIGAIPESVQDGVTGILVPPRDSKAAADAILKLLNDDALRLKMGMAARKRVEENFSLERWVNKTIEVYEKAIES